MSGNRLSRVGLRWVKIRRDNIRRDSEVESV